MRERLDNTIITRAIPDIRPQVTVTVCVSVGPSSSLYYTSHNKSKIHMIIDILDHGDVFFGDTAQLGVMFCEFD